jgi:hypothetical protein
VCQLYQTRPGLATAREALLQPPPPPFEHEVRASAASLASKRARETTAKAWAGHGAIAAPPGSVQAKLSDSSGGASIGTEQIAPVNHMPWQPQATRADTGNVTAEGLQLDLDGLL